MRLWIGLSVIGFTIVGCGVEVVGKAAPPEPAQTSETDAAPSPTSAPSDGAAPSSSLGVAPSPPPAVTPPPVLSLACTTSDDCKSSDQCCFDLARAGSSCKKDCGSEEEELCRLGEEDCAEGFDCRSPSSVLTVGIGVCRPE